MKPVSLGPRSEAVAPGVGLAHVLEPYGLAPSAPGPVGPLERWEETGASVCLVRSPASLPPGLRAHEEPGRVLYYSHPRRVRLFGRLAPVYHALLPHLTFSGPGVEPVWVNADGRAAVVWWHGPSGRTLLLGLDFENEIVRHRQGDPARAQAVVNRAAFGFAFERPNYLFEDSCVVEYRTLPWADHLGFLVAEACARASGVPLLEPLPGGARGAVALTGDDDQAYLEKYDEQLGTIAPLPITYFLHHQTRHTPETLAAAGRRVEIGLHPDAIERPDDYDSLCREQRERVQMLCRRAPRLVRNHGFLNRGYLGHLTAWEENGLTLDVNYPGVDGTALNGSFLPMRVRRADGSWSDHSSLLTAFGDGMLFALHLSEREAVRRVRAVVRQVERDQPGVLVFNLHPQNIKETRRLHRELVHVAGRRGWTALGLESFWVWWETRRAVRITRTGNRLVLTAPGPVEDLALRVPVASGWKSMRLGSWNGRLELELPEGADPP